uniref:Uncharacterized protein n=1 Tax=Arundo donax TaxID=35708 RepID=A0A0A9FHE1_ARUDO
MLQALSLVQLNFELAHTDIPCSYSVYKIHDSCNGTPLFSEHFTLSASFCPVSGHLDVECNPVTKGCSWHN